MSEATSTAGTIGTWVAGFVVLVVSSFSSAYIHRRLTSGKTEAAEKELLGDIKLEIKELHGTMKSMLEVLQRLENPALEVNNESGDVLAPQGVPRASAQVIGANIPGPA